MFLLYYGNDFAATATDYLICVAIDIDKTSCYCSCWKLCLKKKKDVIQFIETNPVAIVMDFVFLISYYFPSDDYFPCTGFSFCETIYTSHF